MSLAPGLTERLVNGARAADFGCGTGHAVVLLAQAFPRSTFVGYDLAVDAVERARTEAARAGVDNAHFEVRDIARRHHDDPYDAVFAFDTVHDLVDPSGTLRTLHDALVPGGAFVMTEPSVSSRLEENIGNPIAPWVTASARCTA